MKVLVLQDLIKEVRDDGDFYNESYITDAQIARKLNKHYKTIYKYYVDSDLGYFVKTFDDVSLLEEKAIYLPNDFYKLSTLDKRSSGGFIPITKVNLSGRENYQYSIGSDQGFHANPLKYYFEDETIKILPDDSTSGVYRFRYYPEAPLIESESARLYEEHTDYITYATIAELKMKKELPWQEYHIKAETALNELKKQLKERALDAPETIADVYSDSFFNNIHYDYYANSYVAASSDSQPQIAQEEADRDSQVDPLDFCFEFDEIDFTLQKPTQGVRGVINRGFENFDSLSVNLKNPEDQVLFSDILESQTFNLINEDGFNDFVNYQVDVDGNTDDDISDRLETIVKSFHVKHIFKKYSDIDFKITPSVGSGLKGNITEAYGLSTASIVGEANKVVSDEDFGSHDESVSIFSGITGKPRHIQFIGVYKKQDTYFFSIIFSRETALDAVSVSDYKIYLDNGEEVDFDLTANNDVSGSGSITVIEKPLSITEETYNKMTGSTTWEVVFNPESSWYLGQNYGKRSYIEDAIPLEIKPIAVSASRNLATDIRPLDLFDLSVLTEKRLQSKTKVSGLRLHQVAFEYAAASTVDSLILGIKDIQSDDVSQFSNIEKVSFFNIKEDKSFEIVESEALDVINVENKVLIRPKNFTIPENFNVSIPRVYTPYAVKEEGNLQVEFHSATDVITTRQVPYGHQSLVNEYVLSSNEGITKVRFQITNLSSGADASGFIQTKVYLNYYDTNGDLQLVTIDQENTDKNLTDFDNQRPITIGVA